VNHGLGQAVEPYGFIFDKDDRNPEEDVELVRHRYTSYTPVASFYVSDRFADMPLPTSEDWDAGKSINSDCSNTTITLLARWFDHQVIPPTMISATGKVFPATFQHKIVDGKVNFEGDPRDLYTEENFKKFYW